MAGSSESTAATSDRAEAFSDAIFAITITLLVLEIPRPPLDEPHLGRHLLDAWPEYAAFGVSFVYVGALWLNHHALFARIRRVDLRLHWINLFILGTSALLPFSTAVLAGAFGTDAPTANQEAAVALYAVVALMTSAAWIPVFPHLSRHPELLERPEDGDLIAAQHSRPWVGSRKLRSRRDIGLADQPHHRPGPVPLDDRLPRRHQRGAPRQPDRTITDPAGPSTGRDCSPTPPLARRQLCALRPTSANDGWRTLVRVSPTSRYRLPRTRQRHAGPRSRTRWQISAMPGPVPRKRDASDALDPVRTPVSFW